MTKVEMKAKESLKQWLEKRYQERKKAYNLLKYHWQGFIEIDLDKLPEKERNHFDYALLGKRALIRPKREILIRMGKGKLAKYRLVTVIERN